MGDDVRLDSARRLQGLGLLLDYDIAMIIHGLGARFERFGFVEGGNSTMDPQHDTTIDRMR